VDQNLGDWAHYKDRISGLSALTFNYDVKTYESSADKMGWVIDHHHAEIGSEPPGPPLQDGAFAKAVHAIRNYEFPDPKLIRALFDPGQELRGRNMLMQAHFLGFTFYFGVRVVEIVDETRPNEAGHPSTAWGYPYRTLQGHFEIGEIRFLIEKDHVSGKVSFFIDAYSRPDRIPNIFYRLGFRLFGRSLQKYFARSSIERMQMLAA
jgi:uncharacterized protein (UPF0548 family)